MMVHLPAVKKKKIKDNEMEDGDDSDIVDDVVFLGKIMPWTLNDYYFAMFVCLVGWLAVCPMVGSSVCFHSSVFHLI